MKQTKQNKEKKKSKGITVKKEQDMSEWYQQVILKSDMIDYSAVSGCIVFKPLSYEIWDKIRIILDQKLVEMGIKKAYFPLLIPESLLKKEAAHVKGFAPEVAWVDYGGNTKLGERLAIRPTSETIMYDSYSRWIRSHRDLPLRICQWNNVVRWEFKHPVPFIRTREFLWVEGHTVFATEKEAEEEIKDIMDLWHWFSKEYLALPGIRGKKTDKEKFAGAEYTQSIEYAIPNGRLVQGPDAHYDGQIFAKAFDITFLDKDEKRKHVFQNTWAITTRMIGIMVMVHGDDRGLVVPPKLAPIQAVIVPILFDKTKEKVLEKCREIKEELGSKFSVHLDDRDEYTPGWKFNEWEIKGVPIRIEIGPKDLEKDQAVMVRRDNNKKDFVKLGELSAAIEKELEAMHKDLLKNAEKQKQSLIVDVKTMAELQKAIEQKKITKTMWCGNRKCEDWIKDKTGGAKIVTIPFDEKPSGKCVHCGEKSKHQVYVAKSY